MKKSFKKSARPLPEHAWLKLNFKFVCPTCGGTRVESEVDKDFSVVRKCSTCGFTWKDSDDERYVFISWKEVRDIRSSSAIGCLTLFLPTLCCLLSSIIYILFR